MPSKDVILPLPSTHLLILRKWGEVEHEIWAKAELILLGAAGMEHGREPKCSEAI